MPPPRRAMVRGFHLVTLFRSRDGCSLFRTQPQCGGTSAMGIRRQTTVKGRLEVKRAWNGGALRYFVATFTPLRPFASIAFCTTAVRFASSTSVASAACASSERPFGSAAATRTIANAPRTIFAPGKASAAGYSRPRPSVRRSAARGCSNFTRPHMGGLMPKKLPPHVEKNLVKGHAYLSFRIGKGAAHSAAG
jgi:hypothetical protein